MAGVWCNQKDGLILHIDRREMSANASRLLVEAAQVSRAGEMAAASPLVSLLTSGLLRYFSLHLYAIYMRQHAGGRGCLARIEIIREPTHTGSL